MKKPLMAKVIVGHRAAYRERLTNEWCFDLARRHTSHLLSLDCREALRQLNILNALPVRLWDGATLRKAAADAGAAQTAGDSEDQPSEAAQRQYGFAVIQARELRSVVVGHYQQIAAGLVCEEKTLPPIAESILDAIQRHGEKRFLDKMELTMRRVARVTVRRERRVGLFPLLSLLAQEWLRDDKRLWKFIHAVLEAWKKDVSNRRSVHRRSTVLHQTAEAHRHDWKELSGHMDKIKAFAPTAAGVPHLLSEMSCDESAKALAKIKKQLEPLKLSPAKLDEEIQKRVGRIRGA